MVADVIEAGGPGAETFLPDVDDLLAEAAPEALLARAADAALVKLVVYHGTIRDAVVAQMRPETLAPVADLAAEHTARGLGSLIAPPHLQLEVLAVLVALPVILAAERLPAAIRGAVERLSVAFHVFPAET